MKKSINFMSLNQILKKKIKVDKSNRKTFNSLN